MDFHANIGPVTLQVVHRHTGLGPSTANYVAVDGLPDQLWLPWMARVTASGPLAENQLMVEINSRWQNH